MMFFKSAMFRTMFRPVFRPVHFGCLCVLVAGLSGCGTFSSDEELILQGERVSVLDLQTELEPEDTSLIKEGPVLPKPWKNEFWPQAGGYPSHSMQHVAFTPEQPQKIWNTDIGEGASVRFPLTSAPIVVAGTIYTLDANHTVSAFDADTGERRWRSDIRHLDEEDRVIGGGISYSRGVLYASNGYNELLGLNPLSGKILWRKTLPAPARAAPTIMDGRIFVMTLDNRILAYDAEDQQSLWEFVGVSEAAGLVGAASPAVNREIVIPAFSSGELFALRVQNGAVAWAESLASVRPASGMASIADIRGLPVIDKGIVIAISFSGRIVAIDARSGARVWSREIGGTETPWVSGNMVYVMSSDNALVALSRDKGIIRWVKQLPRYEKEESKKGLILWKGPLMAGGRLILASSHGYAIEIDPETSDVIREWETGQDVSTMPIIADGVLYLLAENGTLTAYK